LILGDTETLFPKVVIGDRGQKIAVGGGVGVTKQPPPHLGSGQKKTKRRSSGRERVSPKTQNTKIRFADQQ